MTLFTLPPSHYCERARWALDCIHADYVERRLAVGLHGPIMRRVAASTALPVLRIGTGVIQGSDRILDWTMMPGGDTAVEARLDARLGSLVRLYAYSATLGGPDHARIRNVLVDGVPAWQAVTISVGWPILRRAMIAGLDARAERLHGLAHAIEAELDWLEARLGERPYLVGDRFGRADITAASLLSPLARPAVVPLYGPIRFPPEVDSILKRWNERRSLRWVRQIYADHRQAAAAQ